MEAAMISAATLIYNLIVPPGAKKVKSIWKNEEDIKKLGDTIDYIRDVLNDVERKRFQEKSVNEGYKQLRNAFLDAEDFLDRVDAQKKKGLQDGKIKEGLRFFSKSNQAKYALEVNNTITKLRKNLNDIAENMQKFGPKVPSSSLAATQMTARASGPYLVNPTNIIGRDEDKRKIVNLLLRSSVDQENIPVISIVAPGGMGKTTAAQLVYNDMSWQESCKFEQILWVSDSKKLDLKSLLKHILKSFKPVESGLDDLEEDHLKERIVEKIRGKRFLLVLDDVENEDQFNWDNLKGLLDYGTKESRILVTTRSRKVAKVVGSSKSTHELTGLSEEDSSKLFESCAFQGTRDESLVEIGKLIVKKCCGVPLAIKVVGSLLRDEGKHKWEYFRDNSLTEKTDEGNQIMDILKLSYIDLDPTLKQCFSFCALYPKNWSISRDRLRDIWMANVHFKTGNGETVEDACDKSLRILYNRCFLEPEMEKRDSDDTHLMTHDEWHDVEYFKLHDLMHDLVKEVVGAEMLVVNSDKLLIEEDVRHIMLLHRTPTFEPKGTRVRSLIFRGRVENITGPIGKLIHLRFFCVTSNNIKSLPHSIAELINLRTLDLHSCWELNHLPSGMGALISLEVLDLTKCKKLEELPSGIEKLVRLKKLLLQCCFRLTHLPSGMGALTSLEVLDISYCSALKELPGAMEKLTKLKKLLLGNCTELTHLPSGMGALTSLEVLDISYCGGLKELPRGIEKLMKLKKLLLERCSGLARMPSGMGALLGVCEPPTFVVGDPESNHTAQLEELGPLSDLPAQLVIQFPGNSMTLKEGGDGDEAFLLNKRSLRKLLICWQWQRNPEDEEEVRRSQMEVLGKLQPPTSLEEFTLDGYQAMEFPGWMPKDGFAYALPNLVSLSIWHCRGCRYLPRLSRLGSLRYLCLQVLSSLEYIIEEENDSDEPFCLPQLGSLELRDLPALKGWRGGVATNQSLVLPSLSRIDLWDCPNLMAPTLLSVLEAFDSSSSSVNLFAEVCKNSKVILSKGKEDSLALEIRFYEVPERASSYMVEAFRGMSHRLTSLKLWGCKGLKTLPGLHHLNALRELYIENCRDFTWEVEEEEEEEQRVEEEVGDEIDTTRDDSTTTCLHPSRPHSSADQLSLKRLTTLQELTLTRLPNLVTLPEGLQYVTSLQRIIIWRCGNLQVPDWAHRTYNVAVYNEGSYNLQKKKELDDGCSTSMYD